MYGTRLLTTPSSVGSNPHGDMCIPSDRVESDVLGNDRSSEIVKHEGIPISVGRENLKRTIIEKLNLNMNANTLLSRPLRARLKLSDVSVIALN